MDKNKEQIIIDGVNVSDCAFYIQNSKYSCDLSFYTKEELCNCDEIDDCYFKQLARKAQECESLNKRASSLEEIADDLQQRNHHLTQECEELKSQIETYSKMLDSTEFRVALTDVRTGEREVWRELGSKAQRYEQALNNIKNYIYKQECENCEKDRSRCISCKTPKDILDIITKVKDKKCYWDKSIDMSKATLRVDGEIICKFDNDNQTIIVNDNYLNKAKDGKNE